MTHPIKETGTKPPSPHVSFLLFSGGIGARSGHHEPKQFFDLAGHPMIAYSLMAANAVARIAEIIVNAPPGYGDLTRAIAGKYCPDKEITVIAGGETRQDSSLLLTRAARFGTVILHEAARPFVTACMLEELLDCEQVNAGFCLPIPFSMCQVDNVTGKIVKGVPREAVLNIQLPQKLDRQALIAAHHQAIKKKYKFTEDSVMVFEMTGQSFQSLHGNSTNLKVTTPQDFSVAKIIIEKVTL